MDYVQWTVTMVSLLSCVACFTITELDSTAPAAFSFSQMRSSAKILPQISQALTQRENFKKTKRAVDLSYISEHENPKSGGTVSHQKVRHSASDLRGILD